MSPKNIVLTIFLLLSFDMLGQSFGSQNAEWVYDFNGAEIGVTKFKISGDTIVNGVSYQRMEKKAIREKDNGEIVEYPRLPFYIRQESGVLLYTGNFTFEDTLFNFEASIGDSWRAVKRSDEGEFEEYSLTYVVKDTFQTTINGESIFSQAVEIINPNNVSSPFLDTLFENIGSRNFFLVHLDWPFGGLYSDRGVLRCYSNDELGVVDFVPFHESGPYPFNLSGFEYDCDAFLSSIADTQTGLSFSVYPNPTKGFLTIASSEQRIEQVAIYNLSGVLVNSYKPDHTQYKLDVSHLPAGVYFVQINELTFEKIVVLSTSP